MLTGIACEIAELRATLVWRARVGPEGAGGRRDASNWIHGLRHGETKLAQQEPYRAISVQNSPSTSRTAPLTVQNSPNKNRAAPVPVQNSPCSPEMAHFGTFCACMANFVPLSPTRNHTGRTLYRMPGGDGASHNSTPHPTGVEGTGGTGWAFYHRAWLRHPWATAGPDRQIFACNSPAHTSCFEI